MKKYLQNNVKLLITIVFIVLFLFNTVAYSGLASKLAITSDAMFRAYADIRVTGIKLKGTTGNALENYSPKYSIKETTTGFTLPSKESSITYTVTVTNFGDVNETIYDFIKKSSNIDDVNITVTGYNKKDIIPFKTSVEFDITFTTTTPSETPINYIEEYDFRRVYTVEYNNQDGSKILEPQYKYEREDLELRKDIIEKTNYDFKGWTCSLGDFAAGGTYTLDQDIILYPKFEKKKGKLDLNYNIDGTWYYAGYNNKIQTGIKVGGVDKGYFNDFGGTYEYGTSYEIYGFKLDGVEIPYSGKYIVDGTNHLDISFNTINFTANDASLGSITPTQLIVIPGTTFTISNNAITLSDGRIATASPKTVTGYTTKFSSYTITPNSTTINAKTTATANFRKEANTYKVTLDNKSTTTVGTTAIYEKYGTGIYLDSALKNAMTTSANPITKPSKTGYTFKGYYTKENGQGDQIINENGYITDKVTNTTYTANATLYAYWIDDVAPEITELINTSNGNWTNQTIGITVKATDLGSGIKRFDYSYDNKNWVTTWTNGTITDITNGKQRYDTWAAERNEPNTYFRVIDNAGNISASKKTSIRIDKTAPKIELNGAASSSEINNSNNVTIPIKITEIISGINNTEFTASDISILVNGTTVNPSTKILTYNSVSNGVYSYTLTLGGIALNGKVTLEIAAGAVKDITTNPSTKTTLDPSITVSNTYTISLNSNGATTQGTTAIYEKYNTGIYLDSALKNAITTSTNPITKPTKSYTVSFNANNTGITIPNPVKGDYDYLGHYTDATNGTQMINENGYITSSFKNTSYTANGTLYAHWGTKHPVTIPSISKTGYTCSWNTSADGKGTTYNAGDVTDKLNTQTLYAVCKANTYTVTYNSNGGSGTMTNDTATYNSNYITKKNTFARTGYTFNGWNEKSDGTGIVWGLTTSGVYESGKSWKWTYTKNITLYAQWTPNTNTKYIVKHYKQKLDGTYPSEADDTDNLTGTTDSSVSPAVKDVKNNSNYVGFTAPSVQTVTIKADGSTVVTYKYTRNKYTFTLGSAKGVSTSGSTTNGSYYYGSTITLKATASVGYTWSKWTSSNTGLVGNQTTANTTFTMPAGAITMTPTVTVNALTFSDQSKTITYNPSSAQNITITGVSNGSGNYSYSITDGNTSNYFTISGTTITAKAGTAAGTYILTVKASDTTTGATKSATITVTVDKKSVIKPTSPSEKVYNTQVQNSGITTPEGASIVTNGSTVSATNAETYNVIYALNSNYKWSDGSTNNVTVSWKINPYNLSNATISGLSSKTYNGSAQTQSGYKVTVPIPSGKTSTPTYSVSYSNNTNVGTATMTLTGTGNYTGTKSATFSITPKGSTCTISSVPTLKYPGSTTGTIKYSCTGDGKVTITSSKTDIITVSNATGTSATLTAKTIGTSTITVSQAAGTNYSAATSVTNNVTVTYSTYTVTLNGNGATTNGSASAVATYNSTALSTITNPIRKYTITYNMGTTGITKPNNGEINYTFNGWYTAASNGTKVASNSTTPALEASVSGYTNASKQWQKNGNATLYAGWTQGSTTLATLGKTGNSCSWKDSSGNTYASGKTGFTASSNITLTANCTVNQYVLTVNPNGGTWNNSTSASTVTQNYGTTYTVANPTRTGYTFTGWTLSEKGSISGTTYTFADGAGTLTANWKIDTYSITYNLNGGTVSKANPTSYNVATETITLNNPSKTGYTFNGWTGSNDASSGLSYTSSNQYTANGRDHVLGNDFSLTEGSTYRVFVTGKRVAGSLNLQGGIWYTQHSVGNSYDGYNGAFKKGEDLGNGYARYYKDVSIATGYTKGRFYIQLDQATSGGSTSWSLYDMHIVKVSNELNIPKGSTGNKSYTANYKINQYVLTVNPNGGTWNNSTSASTVTQNYGTTYTVANPTRTGYTFTGWTLSGKGSLSGTKYTYADGAGTLTANWTPNTYKVTLDNQGATTAGTTAYYYQYEQTKVVNGVTSYYYSDEKLTTPLDKGYIISKPSKTGYTFKGYYTGTNGTGTQYVDANGSTINNRYKVAGNITLYAYFKDETKPTLTLTNSSNGNWTNGNVTITLKGTDTGSGIKEYQLKYSGSDNNWKKASGTTDNWSAERNETVYYRAVDNAGNVSDAVSTSIKIDRTAPSAPSMSFVYSDWSAYTDNTWTNKDVYAGRTKESPGPTGSTDSASGVCKYQISTDNSTWKDFAYDTSNVLYHMTDSGTYKRYFRAVDCAGNASSSITKTAKIDKVAPADLKLTNSSGGNWTKNNITTTFSATDLTSGVNRLEYSYDNKTWKTESKSTDITNGKTVTDTWSPTEYNSYAYYRAVDNAGNISSVVSTPIKIDKTAPTVAFGTNGISSGTTKASTTVTVTDKYSGVKTSSLKYLWTTRSSGITVSDFTGTNSGTFTNGGTVTLPNGNAGEYYLYIYAEDNLSNSVLTKSNKFVVSNITPEADISVSTTSWTTGNVTFTIKPYAPTVLYDNGYMVTSDRDLNGPTLPTNTYASKKFRISGSVHTLATANNDVTTAIGFNYMADANKWPAYYSVKTGDVKTEKAFNVIATIPSDYKSNLRPWMQININAGTAGYKVEYKNVKYEYFDSTKISKVTVNGTEVSMVDGVGTYTATANGTYNIVVTDTYGNSRTFTKTVSNIDRSKPTYTKYEVKNLSPTGYDVYVYGVTDNNQSGVNRLQFPTWTSLNGQDDIQSDWVNSTKAKGTLQSDGTTWVYRVNTTDHKNESGTYYTHIYAYDNLGNSGNIITMTVTVPAVNITYNYNGINNYFTASSATKILNGFSGSTNYCFGVGTLYLANLNAGDKITVEADVSYSNLTANANNRLWLQGSGNITSWSPGMSFGSVSYSGTGTAKYTSTITLTSDQLKNSYFSMNIRTDNYTGGSITFSNMKIRRTTTSTVQKSYGNTLGTLPTISETGYTLSGWYTTATGGTKVTSSTKVPSADTTYYAHYNINTYTITYNLNGGAVSTANPTSYNVTTATFTLNNPSKTGYTFAGWTGSNGTTAQTSVSIAKGSTGNKSYTANWTANKDTAYKVVHQQMGLDGSTYTTVATENLKGTTGASITPAVKSYTGFTSPSTQTTTIAANGSTVVTYKYTRNKYAYTLGSGTAVTTTGSTASGSYYYGSTITLKAAVSTGYTWSKWTSSNTGLVGNQTTANTTFTMPAGAITMTPSATLNTYTITYNLNGGTVSKANPASYNITTATFTLNNPSKAGYTFTGWTGSNGTTAQTSVSIAKGSTGNKSYTANWTESLDTPYKVVHQQLNLDRTAYVTVETEILKGKTGSSVTPVVKSYTGFASPNTQTAIIKADGSTVVTYQYARNSYGFTLGSATGVTTTGSSASGSYYYGSTITLKAAVSTGYTFTGWKSSNTSCVANQSSANTTFKMPACTVTMTPSATLSTYTVTFNGNGGTTSTGSKSVTYGQTYGTLPTATRSNNTTTGVSYVFEGWYTAASGGTKVTADTKVTITSAQTLYAHWISSPIISGGSASWTSGTRKITLSTASTSNTTGTISYQYYVSTSNTGQAEGTWTNITSTDKSVEISTTGTHYVYYRAVSPSGVTSNVSNYQTTKIDKTPPSTTITGYKAGTSTTVPSNTWSNAYLNFIFNSLTVGPSGGTIYYCTDTDNKCSPGTAVAKSTAITSKNTTDGIYYVRYKVVNGAGVSSSVGSYTAKVDVTDPSMTLKIYKADADGNKTGDSMKTVTDTSFNTEAWRNYGYYFDLTGSSDSKSGIKSITMYTNAAGNPKADDTLKSTYDLTSSKGHSVTSNGNRFMKFVITDNAGNTTTKYVRVFIDTVDPSMTLRIYKANSDGNKTGDVLKTVTDTTFNTETWRNYGYYFDLSESKDNMGIESIKMETNDAGSASVDDKLTTPYDLTSSKGHSVFGNGNRFLKFTVTDKAGNNVVKYVRVFIDTEDPKMTLKIYKADSNGNKTGDALKTVTDTSFNTEAWRNYGYYFDLTGTTDNMVISSMQMEANDAGSVSANDKLTTKYDLKSSKGHSVSGNGNRFLKFTVTDKAGNSTAKYVRVYIDLENPQVTWGSIANKWSSSTTVSYTCKDTYSGFYINNKIVHSASKTATLSTSNSTASASCTDRAGNKYTTTKSYTWSASSASCGSTSSVSCSGSHGLISSETCVKSGWTCKPGTQDGGKCTCYTSCKNVETANTCWH